MVLGRDVGGAGERVTVTTLAELDPEQVDMRTLVIVGSSTTRVVRRGDRDVVFTPRHYGPLTSYRDDERERPSITRQGR